MTPPRRGFAAGFTLLELLVVLVIIGLVSVGVSLTLGDRAQAHLEEEGLRLAAQLEAARARSRASGRAVTWHSTDGGHEFVGLAANPEADLPAQQRWTLPGTQAWISRPPQAPALLLGPEPLLAAQTVTLQQGPHWVQVGTDGLRPFAILAQGQSGEGQP